MRLNGITRQSEFLENIPRRQQFGLPNTVTRQ